MEERLLLAFLEDPSLGIEEQSMILIDQDNGRILETPVGSVFTVRLKESPTTGYRWSLESTIGLEQMGDSFESGGAIGAVV